MTDVKKRANFLAEIHQGLTARADEMARVITAEVGMLLKLSRRIQVGLPVAVLESYMELITHYPLEEEIGNSVVAREPVGVAACITPWNYPLHQIMAKGAPALAGSGGGCGPSGDPLEVADDRLDAAAPLVPLPFAGLHALLFLLASRLKRIAASITTKHKKTVG